MSDQVEKEREGGRGREGVGHYTAMEECSFVSWGMHF